MKFCADKYDMDDFFDEKVKEIKKKYKELGLYTPDREEKQCDGWRFLDCPKSKITDNNGLLILFLNPGAKYEEKYRKSESVEEGNVYLNDWDPKLQRNLKGLFENVSNECKCGKCWEDIIRDSLTSNFIPFRSDGIDELPKKSKCVEFSLKLWTEIIEKNDFTVLICVGKKYYGDIKESVEKQQDVCGSDPDPIDINWGKIKIEYSEIVKGNKKLIVVGLPHFSYFGFVVIKDDNNKDVEKPESKEAVDEICEKIAEYIK